MESVAIVGCGYWGNVLAGILRNKGVAFTHCSSRIELVEARESLTHCSKVVELYNSGGFISKLILATDPVSSHKLIRRIVGAPSFANTSLWLEKPVFLNDSMLASLQLLQGHQSQFFVDYPYTKATLNSAYRQLLTYESLDKKNQNIEINIYSRRPYLRSHPMVYDFLPHHLTILASLFGISPGVLCEVLALTEANNLEITNVNDHLVIIEIRLSSDLVIRLELGISSEKNTVAFMAGGSRQSIDLCDLFHKEPVNLNIDKFLTCNSFDQESCQSWELHRDIYALSSVIANITNHHIKC